MKGEFMAFVRLLTISGSLPYVAHRELPGLVAQIEEIKEEKSDKEESFAKVMGRVDDCE